MPTGRPTVYQEHYPKKAYEFCAEYGFTDKKLARVFDVSEQTLNSWKKQHPEFLESLRAGKDEYDSDRIEKSLRRRARGFSYTETTRELSANPDPVTGEGKLIITKKVGRFIPPDTPAIKLWLCNRRPDRWRDKQDLDLGGSVIVMKPADIQKPANSGIGDHDDG